MAIEVGQTVPDMKLKTSEGNNVTLNEYKGKHVVLYFYPKDSTPGCTSEACSFRDNHESFADLNAEIIGVSPDSAESHQNFKDKHDLPFTLIVDDDHQLAESFGVWKLKKKPDREYWGNERATFIIDKDGVVQKVFRDVNVDGHTDEALQFIRENLA
ncbi:putative peroxiredoxin bcp [Paraliobacillus ryukyuensis]|uniref:thioredoxin-dependent peroxiredoxin n=1 Tax=Paraliobacillus ryukyuensis TaxID=200904 RepID=A0A366DZD2_9BACI|nr:thioredoxin-dependent thiol peroxidase [Paraliobacillus ryukyuensis]RBO95432.1 peroxiredoxin Q/BCP [Paraliobacillus ryukyuensis]